MGKLPKCYIPFGIHFISEKGLFANRITLRSRFEGQVKTVPAITDSLKNATFAASRGENIPEDIISEMSKADKLILYEICSRSRIHINIPNPHEKLIERFTLLKHWVENDGDTSKKTLDELKKITKQLYEVDAIIKKDYLRIIKKIEILTLE